MKVSEEDLRLISGEFIFTEPDPTDTWLLRYSEGELAKRFIFYYVTFPKFFKRVSQKTFCYTFMEHYGVVCCLNFIEEISLRLRRLQSIARRAEETKDLKLLADLKFGNVEISDLAKLTGDDI